jgi:hypothetical protein
MPLFECSKCHCVENTALGAYWWLFGRGLPVLCSECDPENPEGKWHGQFPKQTVAEAGFIQGNDGFLYRPEEIAPGGYFYPRVKPAKEQS